MTIPVVGIVPAVVLAPQQPVIPVTSMDQIKEIRTTRFSTTFPSIDRVLGRSRIYNEQRDVIGESWGMARGKLIVLGGDPGVGKTTLYTLIAIMLVEYHDLKIVIFQNEMSAGEYKEMVLNMYQQLGLEPRKLQNIIVEESRTLERQIEVLRVVKPDLAINDSFNLTREPNAQTKKGIEQIILAWKEAIRGHTAALFVAHQNKQGTIKGDNHFDYMVDGIFYMKWATAPETEEEERHLSTCAGRIRLSVGKNRQGASGVFAELRRAGESLCVVSVDSPEQEVLARALADEMDELDLQANVEIIRAEVQRVLGGEGLLHSDNSSQTSSEPLVV